MTQNNESNQLITVLKNNQLEIETENSLKNAFLNYWTQADELVKQAKNIIVTDETQLDAMNEARKLRIEIKNIRIETEKTRKLLKEDSLRKGKAIDGIANVIKYLIAPVEEYLEKQEKFIEIKQENERIKRAEERLNKLLQYCEKEDVLKYDLKNMEENIFNLLLDSAIKEHDKKIEEQKRIEAEKIEAERKRKEEEEQRKIELEKLKKEKEEQDRQREKERLEHEAKLKKEREEKEKIAAELKRKEDEQKEILRKQKEEQDRQREKERLEHEAKLKKEREEKERAEAELKRIEDEKRKAIEEEKARIEAMLKAPDKEKLSDLALLLTAIEMPEMKSEVCKEIIINVQSDLNRIVSNLKIKISKL